jgi:hypothetical protein
MKELRTDPARERAKWHTGLYVRAKNSNGNWGDYDISQLTRNSLLEWLRAEPGRAESVVLLMVWGAET